NSSGNVYYARTYNWSRTSVMTGNTPVTTEFTNAAAAPPGTYSLVVVANGISSDPFSFTLASPTTYSISPNLASVNENAGYLTFTITRSSSASAATVYASTVQDQGYANPGGNYYYVG